LLAVAIAFIQTAGHEFVNLDDNEYVYENWHVQQGLTIGSAAWAVTSCYALNWHPLTWLSHMLDCQLCGVKPAGHHLTSLVLHAAAAIVLFLALRKMTSMLWPSAFVAAVFAIHPLRVESVAWVAERKDVLSGLFFMLTLHIYARYTERPSSWGRYVLLLTMFALGLTAKPMLVSTPFVLLLLDFWPLERWQGANRAPAATSDCRFPSRSWKSLLIEKLPLFVLTAASCAVTLAAQRSAIHTLEQRSFATRAANAVVAYVAYLAKMVWPTGLAAIYPLPKDPPSAWQVSAAASVLLGITAVCFALRRKRPYLLFGWLWYVGTLVPVIGLVQVGSQSMADRYTYLTQIGLCVSIAWAGADIAGVAPSWRGFLAAASALIIAALTICAWQQTSYWRDGESLWTHTLACTAENPLAENNLALVLSRHGRAEDAAAHYTEALRIKPDFAEAHNNFGLLLADRGQGDAAIKQFSEALDLKPSCAEAHFNLGRIWADRGKTENAIAEYRQALSIKPDYVEAFVNLGNNLADRGQAAEAIAALRKALEIWPGCADAHYNLANTLAGRGEPDEAIAHYRKAVEIKPDYLEAQFNLAVILDGRGKLDEALPHYQRALGLAVARNDTERAEWLRAKIKLIQPGTDRRLK
jgi:tetratricopeptide (TPR) repeat protein